MKVNFTRLVKWKAVQFYRLFGPDSLKSSVQLYSATTALSFVKCKPYPSVLLLNIWSLLTAPSWPKLCCLLLLVYAFVKTQNTGINKNDGTLLHYKQACLHSLQVVFFRSRHTNFNSPPWYWVWLPSASLHGSPGKGMTAQCAGWVIQPQECPDCVKCGLRRGFHWERCIGLPGP